MWKLPEQDLEALVSEFERSSWREMRLRMHGVELILSKDSAPVYRQIPGAPSHSALEPEAARVRPAAPEPLERQPAVKVEAAVPAGWVQVRAPTLGTFFRASKPGAPPFVEVGDPVSEGTEVCLVEVMKLFTTVRAGVSGIVREVYAQDGDLVEFEQPLFLVEPGV